MSVLTQGDTTYIYVFKVTSVTMKISIHNLTYILNLCFNNSLLGYINIIIFSYMNIYIILLYFNFCKLL